ncbi:DUF58 domain-containing protein [filamentous cyanobacterium LEGE 11480]|uniref:DUF58 domain-containing protein n=1 Tax=Romeriopsis navalis LEGE 11480 TaxID=2777977 RepID=A0A928VJN6_9CYAN|nr:DUF58 domain-containing protein [Romeriopsis navalis]MBE9028872.1 DUF58 domain-containing protein [Romeriopsis navalis LEGE 11480]
MIPTARVYALLMGAAVMAVLGLLFWPGDGRLIVSLMVLLGLNILVLAMMLLDSLKGYAQLVKVERQGMPRLSIGRDNPVQLTVTNPGPKTTVQIRDGYPQPHFTVSEETLSAVLEPGITASLSYTVQPTMRGEYRWGVLQVRQLSPWGLAWLDQSLPQAQTVQVYPDLVGLRSLTLKLTLAAAGAIRQKRRLGIGTEFAELRDYNPGDDLRLIDWKATARRDRPLVRVLEPEQEQTLIILLDRGRLMTAQVQGLSRFDWGLNATLALALAGLNRGDKVGVAVFDRAIHTWIPPQRGQSHLNHLIERLTPIQPELLEPDYLGAANVLVRQQSRRALVVVITDLVDQTASAELLQALSRMAPRYLPFCVTLRDPQIDRQAAEFSTDVDDNFERAVALDLLAQRRKAFALLQQKGVLVLDAPANQISEQLVDRYLQLKLSNRL